MSIKDDLTTAMKAAMKQKEKEKLTTLRMALAAIKQVQIDKQIELNDTDTTELLTKLVKQRKDAALQFEQGGRPELAAKELREIKVLQVFLPEGFSEEAIAEMIRAAIESTGAESAKDMGKVMGVLKPQLTGRADLSQVSQQVKARLEPKK